MTGEPGLTLLWSADEIAARVRELAREIDRDYADETPVLVGVLKGGFVFLADLARQLRVPVEIEFIRLSSYTSGTTTSGRARVIAGPPRAAIEGRPVLVVDDILDTGLTTRAALRHLQRKHPASLRLCTLLDRPERRRVPVRADYAGFTLSGHFVVGYGLDVDQKLRQLPGIYGIDEPAGQEE